MAALDSLASLLLQRIAWTSLQAALLVGALALLVRALPRLPAAARCLLWWLVALQVVLGLAWHAPVALPLLAPAPSPATAPASTVTISVTHERGGLPVALSSALPSTALPAAPSPRAPAPAQPTPRWRIALAAAWLLGLLAQLPSLLREALRTRRLLREAAPLDDPDLDAACARQARALGLRRAPMLRASAAVDSPQVVGLRRTVVLLPAGHRLPPHETALALAHELAHLRRGDLWLGWLPALAQRLLFFHLPLRWAMREYALEREAACDALALRQAGGDARDYGRLLLRLGVARPLHAGLAGASPTFRNLKRRLTMLEHASSLSPAKARHWLLLAPFALLGVLPYRVTAHGDASAAPAANTTPAAQAALAQAVPAPDAGASAAVPATSATPATPSTTATPPVPATTPVPAVPAIGAHSHVHDHAHNGVPPVPAPPPPLPPAPPAPPAPPPPPPAPATAAFSAHHVDIDTHEDTGYGLALIDGDSVMINGTESDLAAASRLRDAKAPVLWFRRGDKAYVIHDKATLERAHAIYAPLAALAGEQGKLAGMQGRLSGMQAGLAARNAAFAQELAALAQQRVQLTRQEIDRTARDTAHAEASPSPDAEALRRDAEAQQRAVEAQQRALASTQARLETRRASMEAEQAGQEREYASQQAALEKQQLALQQRQRTVEHDARQAMDHLLDEALSRGIAQPAAR